MLKVFFPRIYLEVIFFVYLFPSLHNFFLDRLVLWSWRKAKDSRSYYSSSPPIAHVKTLHTTRTSLA